MTATTASARTDPIDELYCAEEGWGPWWVPREHAGTRHAAKRVVCSFIGERPCDYVVHAKRGRLEWRDQEGWWFTVDPAGDFRVWEVSQK